MRFVEFTSNFLSFGPQPASAADTAPLSWASAQHDSRTIAAMVFMIALLGKSSLYGHWIIVIKNANKLTPQLQKAQLTWVAIAANLDCRTK